MPADWEMLTIPLDGVPNWSRGLAFVASRWTGELGGALMADVETVRRAWAGEHHQLISLRRVGRVRVVVAVRAETTSHVVERPDDDLLEAIHRLEEAGVLRALGFTQDYETVS